MVNHELLFNRLSELGVNFYTGVTDSLLNDFCLYAIDYCDDEHNIIAANEGNAIGIAAGYYFSTGKLPVVYMQNSGIGNAMNPLLSLTHQDVYSIPMILVIGWRGDPSIIDHVQHKRQGELTTVLMDDMNIPYEILDKDDMVISKFEWAVAKAKEISAPVALIAKKGILSKSKKETFYPEEGIMMNREDAMDIVFDFMPDDTIYSATTGRATRELHEMFVKRNLHFDREFLNVGSMGHNSSVALGMAVGCPERHYVVFDGDSATLMHLGALTTTGKVAPKHFLNIVLNNGAHESVGGQPTIGFGIDYAKLSAALGYKHYFYAENTEELQSILKTIDYGNLGTSFLEIRLAQGSRKDLGRPKKTPIENKNSVMEYLKC